MKKEKIHRNPLIIAVGDFAHYNGKDCRVTKAPNPNTGEVELTPLNGGLAFNIGRSNIRILPKAIENKTLERRTRP